MPGRLFAVVQNGPGDPLIGDLRGIAGITPAKA
jgi:hypothetical protein